MDKCRPSRYGSFSYFRYFYAPRQGQRNRGDRGNGPLQNFKWGDEGAYIPSKFFNYFFSIFVLQCHFFAHLQNSTIGNTDIDAVEQVHVHLIVDLDLHVMLLET